MAKHVGDRLHVRPTAEGQRREHFSSRSFAPLGKVCAFANPLADHEFAAYVKVGQSTPSTPLYEREFGGLKSQLSERNPLPDFLKRARIGGESFRDVTQQNWPSISCSSEARFINEARSCVPTFWTSCSRSSRIPARRC